MTLTCWRTKPFLAALILPCLLAGCFGYHVGPVADIDYRTVAVPMFANRTVRPQLEAQVTNGIIKRLHQDGSLQVVDRELADVVVVGKIVDYQRSVLRTEKDDTGVPREYRVTVVAQVEIRDRRNGTRIVEPRRIEGAADTFIGTDLQAADYQALPLAADALARKVVTLLTERWE
jgi:hypothetical protein